MGGVEDGLVGPVEGVADGCPGRRSAAGELPLHLGEAGFDRDAGGDLAAAVAAQSVGDGEDEAQRPKPPWPDSTGAPGRA